MKTNMTAPITQEMIAPGPAISEACSELNSQPEPMIDPIAVKSRPMSPKSFLSFASSPTATTTVFSCVTMVHLPLPGRRSDGVGGRSGLGHVALRRTLSMGERYYRNPIDCPVRNLNVPWE